MFLLHLIQVVPQYSDLLALEDTSHGN